MEGFSITDGVALVVVLVSAVLAYSRGFTREVLAILGWAAAAVAAFYFAPQVVPLVQEIPYVKDVIATSCQLSILAAFAVVFAVALVVLSIFTPLFAAAVQESALGPIDRGAGFLFGILRGALLVIVAILVYQSAGQAVPDVDTSRTVALLSEATARVKAEIPTDMPGWIESRYNQLIGNCDARPAPATAPSPAPLPPATTAPSGT